MLSLVLILVIIACALLILIILAQNPKGGGLSNLGAGAGQLLGARQTADFLEKATWYFGLGILVVVVLSYFISGTPTATGPSTRTEGVDFQPPAVQTPPAGQPGISPAPEGAAPANP